jgi:disulfide bond formation protein DsbB
MAFLDLVLRRWPIFALAIAAAMLAIAHGFETFGHLPPCHLCLLQRDVYWAAIGVAGLGLLAIVLRTPAAAPRIDSLVLALVFAVGAGIAGYHAGAEWGWWKAPASCASTGAKVSVADLQALLAGHGVGPPACDKAPWVFLGLSMAGWNFLASLALVALSLAAAGRKETA